MLTQPPVRWSVENASFAYLATSIVLGRAGGGRPAPRVDLRAAAAQRPRPRGDRAAPLAAGRAAGPGARREGGRRRSIAAGASGLVAGVLGASAPASGSTRRCWPSQGNQIDGRARVRPRPIRPATTDGHAELADLPRADPDKPFALADVEQAVTQVAVNVLQARGEPASARAAAGRGADRPRPARPPAPAGRHADVQRDRGGQRRCPSAPDLTWQPDVRSRRASRRRRRDAEAEVASRPRQTDRRGRRRRRQDRPTGRSARRRPPTTSGC